MVTQIKPTGEGVFPDDNNDTDYIENLGRRNVSAPAGNSDYIENLGRPAPPTVNPRARIAVDDSPDDIAQAINAANSLGYPSALGENSNAAKFLRKEAEAKTQTSILQRHPKMQEQFEADTPLYKLTTDDMPVLDRLGALVDNIKTRFDVGESMVPYSELKWRQMFGYRPTLDEERFLRETKTKLNTPVPTEALDDISDKFAVHGAEQIGLLKELIPSQVAVASLAGVSFGGPAALAGGPAAGVGVGLTAAGSAFLLKSFWDTVRLEGGLAFDEYLDIRGPYGDRIDEDTARGAAISVGLVNGAIEVVGLKLVGKAVGVERIQNFFTRDQIKQQLLNKPTMRKMFANIGKRFLAIEATEITQEVLQELTTTLGGELAKANSDGSFDYLSGEEYAERIAQIIEKTAFGVAPVAAVGTVPSVVMNTVEYRNAKNQEAFFQALAGDAESSKLRERMPEKFAALLDKMAEDGPVKSVHVDANKLIEMFQSEGGSVQDLIDTLPSVAEQLETAAVSNTTVEVSIGEFAAQIAGTPAYTRIAPHIKLSEDGMTAAEATAFEETFQEDLERETRVTQERAEEIAASEAPADRVFQDVVSQMEAAGEVNTDAALLYRHYFKTMGERMNMDPYELYQQNRVEVEGPIQRMMAERQVTRTDLQLDRIRSGKAPKQEDLYGASLVETLANQGGVINEAGQLTALEEWHKKNRFKRKAINEEGLSLEDATTLAINEGFLPEGASSTDLVAAANREAAGEPQFSPNQVNEAAIAEMEETNALREMFEFLDYDITDKTNQEVKDFLEGVEVVRTPAGEEFFQQRRQPPRAKNGQYKGAPEGLNTPQKLSALRRTIRKLAAEGVAGQFWYEQSAEMFLQIAAGDLQVAEKLIQLAAIYSPQTTVKPNTHQAIKAYNLWKNGVSREDFYVRPFGQKEDKYDDKTGKLKPAINLDTKAIDLLYDGKNWDGRKTQSFYLNLMNELVKDLSTEQVSELSLDADVLTEINKVVTVDMWMKRAYGYRNDLVTGDKGGGVYSFVSNEMIDLAQQLTEDTGRVVLPHQVQAMVWTAAKARWEDKAVIAKTKAQSLKRGYSTLNEKGKWTAPKGADNKAAHLALWRGNALKVDTAQVEENIEEAKFSFADGLNMMTEFITWETIPSDKLNHPISSAPLMEQLAFTVAARKIVTDTSWGSAEELKGTPLSFFADSFGGYDTNVVPNIVTGIVPTKEAGAYSRDEVEAYARFMQYVFKQDAVPWIRIDPTLSFKGEYSVYKVVNKKRAEKPSKQGNKFKFDTYQEADAFAKTIEEPTEIVGGQNSRAVLFTFDRDLDVETQDEIYTLLRDRMKADTGFTMMAPNEMLVANFRNENGVPMGPSDGDFIELMQEIANERQDITEAGYTSVEGNYGPFHDWRNDREGKALLNAEAFARSPDLQNRAKDRRLVYEALLARAEAGEFARPSELYQSEVGTLSEPDIVAPREKITAPIPMDRLRRGGRSLAENVLQRFGQTTDRNTEQDLKLYDLTELVENPEITEQLLDELGYTVKYFSFEENKERGVEVVIPRLGRNGYAAGNLWIYDPRVESGSFKDVEYTRAWRITHEAAHGITERIMQQKHGDSRRYGRLGRTMQGERGKPPKRVEVTLEPLTLLEAQRAVEWEDMTFRVQRMLLEELGISVSDEVFAQEYNVNISDAVFRLISGDFGNPSELGFVPSKELPNLRQVLQLLERTEGELAQEQGRAPTAGIELKRWRGATDSELRTELQLRRLSQDPEMATDTAALVEKNYTFEDATESTLYVSDREVAVPSPAKVRSAVNKGQLATIKQNIKVARGAKVGVRLDLPAFRITGTPVQTVHDKDAKGPPLRYQGSARLKNATFVVGQTDREAVAANRAPKSPFASVNGEYAGTSKDATGIEVFFDPKREHLFRDGYGRPLKFAEDVTVTGTRAYARGRVEYYTAEEAPARAGEATTAVEFFQDEMQQEGKRGSILLAQDQTQPSVIRLFESKDLSTFLHESGHFFLHTTQRLAQSANATPELQAEWDTITKWLGVDRNATLGTEQHEKWAETFEAYLREGKAPSRELQGAFAKFRAWLLGIYRQLRQVGGRVQLDDTITGVFDRMLASDEAIAAAEEANSTSEELNDLARALSLSEKQTKKLLDLAAEAREQAVSEVEQRILKETTVEAKKLYDEEAAAIRDEVAEEIDKMPVYQAIRMIREGVGEGALKMSRKRIVEIFGGPEILRQLGGSGSSLLWQRKGGADPDFLAGLVGYDSGEKMILDIVNSPSRKEAIDQEIDRRVKSKIGDALNDGSIADQAQAAVRNDKKAQLLRQELELLRDESGEAFRIPTAAQTQSVAEKIVAESKIRNNKEGTYAIAERKAARAVIKAVAKKEWAEAARQKRIQLLNFYLAKESRAANESVEKGLRLVRRLSKASVRSNIDVDYLDQIDGILDRYEFKKISNKAAERRVALGEWVREQEESGQDVSAIDPEIMNEAKRVPYREIPFAEFDGVMDALTNIATLGRKKTQLYRAEQKLKLEETVTQLEAAARANMKWKTPEVLIGQTSWGKKKAAFSRYHAAHIRPEFAFLELDGNEIGVWHEAMFQPLADAEEKEFDMMQGATKQLMDLFKLYSLKERALWYRDRTYFPSIGQSLTKSEQISVALNWGNQDNRTALLAGYGWTPEGALEIIENLNERDWQFVQGIWDLIDQFWPQISALQRRTTGVVPKKVMAEEVVTPYGTIRGGYYPLVYDPKQNYVVFQRDEKLATGEMFGGNYARASTRKGHTKERVGSGGAPVLLDMSVITSHIKNVVHDLTHREVLMDVDRLVQHPKVRESIESTLGRDYYRTLRPWLKHIASDLTDPTNLWEQTLTRLRHGATYMNMGLKLTTMLVQPFGYTQTINEIGSRWSMHGIKSYYGNPASIKESTQFVLERSTFMKDRMTNFDRDVRDVEKRLGSGVLDPVRGTFLAGIGIFDMSISLPSWLGAYAKAMNESNDEARAIKYADTIVRITQGSGGPKDLANIQTGHPLMKLFTMFYSYFSVLYNMMNKEVRATKGINDIPNLVLASIWLILIPATITEMVLGRGPEEDEDLLWWALKKTAAYPFQAIVGVRDIVGSLESGFDYQLSPVTDVVNMAIRATRKAGEGDLTERSFIKPAFLAIGAWYGMPARQLWMTTEYIYDYLDGEVDDFSFYEALVTGDKDK